MIRKCCNLIFLIPFIIILGTCEKIHSQNSEIIWSPDFVEAKGDRMGKILHDDGTNVYVFVYMLSKGKKEMTPGIIKMDSKMTPVIRKDYSASAPSGTDVYMIGMYYCGGKFIMLSYTTEKGFNGKVIQATSIDMATLNPLKESTIIWKMAITPGRFNKLDFTLSADSLSFALNSFDYKLQVDAKDKEPQRIFFKVFDSDLNVVNTREKILPYTNEQCKMLDYVLSNDGTVFYFGKNYTGKPGKEITKDKSDVVKANYNLVAFKCGKDGNDSETPIDMAENLLDNLSAVADPVSKKIMMFATYADLDKEPKFLTGYEFFRFNPESGSIETRQKHVFTPELIAQLDLMEHGFRSKKNSLFIPKTFNIWETLITTDGRLYFILENDFSWDAVYSKGIISILHDKDGNRKWINYIPKNQMINGGGYETLAYPSIITRDNKLVILYNDHDQIHKLDPFVVKDKARAFDSKSLATYMIAEINNEGIMNRRIYSTSEKMGTPVKTTQSLQGANNRYLLYGWKGHDNSNKIGVMNID